MIIDSPIISGSYAASGSLNQTGDIAITGSLTVTGTIIGAVTGSVDSASFATSASYASISTSSSYSNDATSASYALTSTSASHALNADNAISSSHALNADNAISSSHALFANDAATATSASHALNADNAISSSHALNADNAISSSHALNADNAISSSFAATSSFADNFTVAGEIVAQTLNVQQVTSSIIYSSGSNVFGNDLSNTQVFTGSLQVTGSNHYILGGNVGIGVSSPTYKLDINSYDGTFDKTALRLIGGESWGGGATRLILGTGASGDTKARLSVEVGGSGLGGSLRFENNDTSNTLQTNLIITPTGIATFSCQVVANGGVAGNANDNYFGNYPSGDYFNIGNLGATGNVYLEGRGTSTNINQQYRAKGQGSHIWSYNAGSNEIMRTTSAGYLGIGTTSPNTKLDVSGSVSVAGGSEGLRIGNVGDNSAYDNVKIYYSGYNGGSPEVIFTPRTTPGSGALTTYFRFKNSNGTSSDNNIAGLTVDGSVGIGTTSPSTKLHIDTSVENTAALIVNSTATSGAGGTGIAILNDHTATGARNWAIVTENNVNGDFGIFQSNAKGGNPISGGTAKLYIDNVGNVGISTTSPDYKLDVDGGSSSTMLRVSTTNTGASVAGLILANSSKIAFNDGVKIAHGAGYTNITDLCDNNVMSWDMSNRRVGINTVSPGSILDVRYRSDGENIYRASDSTGLYRWRIDQYFEQFLTNAAGTDKVKLSADGTSYINGGNVGIGITSPQAQLDVLSSLNVQAIDNSDVPYINFSNNGREYNWGRVGGLLQGDGDGALYFSTKLGAYATEKLRITSTGVACFANTICTPAVYTPAFYGEGYVHNCTVGSGVAIIDTGISIPNNQSWLLRYTGNPAADGGVYSWTEVGILTVNSNYDGSSNTQIICYTQIGAGGISAYPDRLTLYPYFLVSGTEYTQTTTYQPSGQIRFKICGYYNNPGASTALYLTKLY